MMKPVALFLLIQTLLYGATGWAGALATLEKSLMANNPQLLSLQSRVDAEKATAQSMKSRWTPRLSLVGGYGDDQTLDENDQGYVGFVRGEWNVFNGGIDYQEYQIAHREQQIAQWDLEIQRRALRRQLHELYYALLSNKKMISLQDEKTELFKQHRQMAQKKINAGLSSGVDAIEIDLEENLLATERERLTTEAIRLLKELRTLLNSEIDDASISASESMDTTPLAFDLPHALEKNPSLKKQNQLEEISLRHASQSRSELLPKVDFEASYGQLTPNYGDPLRAQESKVSLLLSWEIFSGLSGHYRTQASAANAKSQNQISKSLHLELKKDLENLATTGAHLQTLKSHFQRRRTLAQKYYELTLVEYKRGVKNSSDLETATTSLFETRQKLIELDRDLNILNAKINEFI